MREEEQERFEDYLDLERYIEHSRLQRSASPPANLTPQLTRVYEMAALFRAASPPTADPSPEFGAQLYQRLREQMQAPDQRNELSQSHAEAAAISSPPAKSKDRKKRRGISRRTLFASGSIAASLVGGAAIGAAIERSLEPPPVTTDLNPHIRGAAWHTVASVDQLGQDPIHFTTGTITGYVIRQAENSTEPIIAFSAACTHLGCTVQWQGNKRQFPCPCHGRTFDTTGSPVYSENSKPHYVSLPRLETKIENGNIYVKIPVL
jgi:Rieske Fe-S protein